MKEKLHRNPAYLFIMFMLSLASAGIFYSLREYWVFYSQFVPFLGGAVGLFLIIAANTLLLLILYALRKYQVKRTFEIAVYKKLWFGALSVLCTVLTLLSVGGVIGLLVIGGAQSDRVMLLYLKQAAPWIALVFGAALVLAVLPAVKGIKRAVFSVFAALIVLCGVLWQVFPVLPYRITSDPLVLDTGAGYSVVFATNAKGTGFVEYSYEGEQYCLTAEKNGRIIGDRLIHSVHVPYEHLRNNSYSVGSTRVIEEYSYGSRLGNTVKSDVYTFTAPEGDMAEYLLLSDWHSYTDRALQAVSYLGDYNAVILMGDAAAGMDFEEEAASCIVEFGGRLTGGEMPAIFVRGNHDTRGGFADDLADHLGLETFYYTVNMGDVSFIVLDSGEDKEDSHVEYGGMNAFAENRRETLQWLQDIEPTGAHKIALSHAWLVSEPEEVLSRAAWDRLDKLGVRFMLSGHEHVCRFLNEENETEAAYLEAYPDMTAYIDGGISGENYIASKIIISSKGVHFVALDRSGNTVMHAMKYWNGR